MYTAHRGWAAPKGSDAWLAYRLKKAVPLAAAVGIAVHDAAATCVRALAAGNALPSFQALRVTAAQSLNARWRNSRTQLAAYLESPARVPVFLEALYGGQLTSSDLHRASQTLDRALLCLCQCETVWGWVRSAAPADVIMMDPFTSMEVRDHHSVTLCYGAADLIVRPGPNEPWHIVDFKSGAADGVIDQILTYALIAREVLHLQVDPGCVGAVVSLGEEPSECVATFPIDGVDLRDAEERLRDNIEALRGFLADPTTGAPLEMAEFPMTASPRLCSWCAYRALCHPSEVPWGIVIHSADADVSEDD